MANKLKAGIIGLVTLVSATITTPAWAVSSEQVKKEYQQFSSCLAQKFAEKNKTEQPETPYAVRVINDGEYGPEIFIFGERTDGIFKDSRQSIHIYVDAMIMMLGNNILLPDGRVDTRSEEFAPSRKIYSEDLNLLIQIVPGMDIVEKCFRQLPKRAPAP